VTLAPHRAPLVFEDLDGVVAAIRARGGRLTSARRVLLEGLFAADGLVSAEKLADGMDGRTVRSEVSSVYRNLELFEQLGVVRHVHLGHGPGLYALERGGGSEYLVCERCDRVEVLEPADLDPLRAEVRARFGYEVRFSHFPIVGLCPACAAAPGAEAAEAGPAPAHQHGHAHPHRH
jgi:Fur family ferric uptake transcriptional regulator